MLLTRHHTPVGARWALQGKFLPSEFNLGLLLSLPKDRLLGFLEAIRQDEPAQGALLAPIEPMQEVWASGVTYLRSRHAREAESEIADVYTRVYEAKRPELFFKSNGWRVVGHRAPLRIRADSRWNVPEPELTLVINRYGEIIGYTAGNDMSSRDIEGENPLYLPQAKIYNGACALGPGIKITYADELSPVHISLEITREGEIIFSGETSTNQMKRAFTELVAYLTAELDFPQGAFLLTGTGVIPPEQFSLQAGDAVSLTVGELTLSNPVIE